MRGESSDGFFGQVNAVKWLLIANIGVFVLQNLFEVWVRTNWFSRLFALEPGTLVQGMVWTPLTYSLLHSGLGHIFFNLLLLFFVGRALEPRVGAGRFLEIYGAGALVGGIMWLTFNWGSTVPLVGASGAIIAILTVFCILYAEDTIQLLLFFVVPVRIKPKFILIAVLAFNAIGFLFYEIAPGTSSPVAFSAHLGGVLGGYVYLRYLYERGPLLRGKGPRVEAPGWFRHRQRKAEPVAAGRGKRHFEVNISNRRQLKNEVDRILDKINTKGFGALSDEEKKVLERARDILSR